MAIPSSGDQRSTTGHALQRAFPVPDCGRFDQLLAAIDVADSKSRKELIEPQTLFS